MPTSKHEEKFLRFFRHPLSVIERAMQQHPSLTHSRFSTMLGMSASYVSKSIQQGKGKPSLESVQRIAHAISAYTDGHVRELDLPEYFSTMKFYSPEDHEGLKQKLEDLYQQTGISRNQLSNLLGVSTTSLISVENGACTAPMFFRMHILLNNKSLVEKINNATSKENNVEKSEMDGSSSLVDETETAEKQENKAAPVESAPQPQTNRMKPHYETLALLKTVFRTDSIEIIGQRLGLGDYLFSYLKHVQENKVTQFSDTARLDVVEKARSFLQSPEGAYYLEYFRDLLSFFEKKVTPPTPLEPPVVSVNAEAQAPSKTPKAKKVKGKVKEKRVKKLKTKSVKLSSKAPKKNEQKRKGRPPKAQALLNGPSLNGPSL